MSLHAELSPEALAKLHAQRRNSTISSIVIAILAVVLVALLLGIFLLPQIVKETPTIVTYESSLNEDATLEQKKVTTTMERKPSSPSSSMAKVITANTASPTAVPSPDIDITTPSVDFGDGNDFGNQWGEEEAVAGGFGNIPATMKKRCSKEDRLGRLKDTGGTPECEDAVVKGLDWLKSTQKPDGSWTSNKQTAMTGLALLAMLGHCETPLSEKYGDCVLRAMTYLINVGMKNKGKLTTNAADKSWCYEHAIATYALGEAATFCKQGNINVPNLMEVTQMAGQIIIDNQNETGGWAYSYEVKGGHVDLSVAAWQVQALKACYHTGLEFKGMSRAISKAMDYVDDMACRDGGFAYAKADEKPHADGYRTLTGAGMLSLQMWDKGAQSAARNGAKYIMNNSKFDFNGPYSDLYGHYYEAQAMMNRGGEDWKFYNAMFRDQLLKNQNPDGSWKSPNKGSEKGMRAVVPQFVSNVHYRTTLCILMLEVYYRFLPGTGAGTK